MKILRYDNNHNPKYPTYIYKYNENIDLMYDIQ